MLSQHSLTTYTTYSSSTFLKQSLSKNSAKVIPAPSQKLNTVETLGHFVRPFIKSYNADGDLPPPRQAPHTFLPRSSQISFILFTIAWLMFIYLYRGTPLAYSTISINYCIYFISWSSTNLTFALNKSIIFYGIPRL